jgi:hypothetical protein
MACSGIVTGSVVEAPGRADCPLVPAVMPAPKPMAAGAAASALRSPSDGVFGSVAVAALCLKPLSTVVVGRSASIAREVDVRPKLAQGAIWPAAGPAVAMARPDGTSGSVAVPALCLKPLSTVVVGQSASIVPEVDVRPKLAQGSILPAAGLAAAIACSGNATGSVVEVFGGAGIPLVPIIMPAPKPTVAKAAASALVFCSTPLSTVSVGPSPWVVLDTLARLRPAQGPILPGAGRMLAEGAGPAVAIACSGSATAFVVEALGRAERLLVPLLMPAPKPMAARASASALAFCSTSPSTVSVGPSP